MSEEEKEMINPPTTGREINLKYKLEFVENLKRLLGIQSIMKSESKIVNIENTPIFNIRVSTNTQDNINSLNKKLEEMPQKSKYNIILHKNTKKENQETVVMSKVTFLSLYQKLLNIK